VISARVRGVLLKVICGPCLKAGTLGLSRRHFLPDVDDFGVGSLHPVELLVRHAVQLFRREMHVLMQVLVLLGSREAEMLHEQLQRLVLVCPAHLDTRLLRERLEIGVGDGFEVAENVFNPNFHRLNLLACFAAIAACTLTFLTAGGNTQVTLLRPRPFNYCSGESGTANVSKKFAPS